MVGVGLPAEIVHGIQLFNAGEFYEAHEVMEKAWRATPGDERLFYQGLIQAAVALWRVQRGDAQIALTMCSRALPKLELFRPVCRGVDAEALFRGMQYVRDQVAALRKGHLDEFDRGQFPRIRFVDAPAEP